MYKTALLEFFVYASHASHLDILGLSEAKGRGNGTKVIDSVSYGVHGGEGRQNYRWCRHCGGGAMARLYQKLEMRKVCNGEAED